MYSRNRKWTVLFKDDGRTPIDTRIKENKLKKSITDRAAVGPVLKKEGTVF